MPPRPNSKPAQQQAAAAAGGTATPVVFASTPAMINHKDLINYQSKSGVMVYDEGRKALTTPFDMKSNRTVVYITELQARCIKMGWSTGANKSCISQMLLAQRSTSLTSTARSILPRSRRHAKLSALPEERSFSSVLARTTQ